MSQGRRPRMLLGLLVAGLVILAPVGTYYTLRTVRRQQFSLLENEVGWAIGTMQSKSKLTLGDIPRVVRNPDLLRQSFRVDKMSGVGEQGPYLKWGLSVITQEQDSADVNWSNLLAEIVLVQHAGFYLRRPEVRVEWHMQVDDSVREALDAVFTERRVEYRTSDR